MNRHKMSGWIFRIVSAILVIFFSGDLSFGAYDYSKSDTGRILNEFKEKEKEFIFSKDPFVDDETLSIFSKGSELEILEKIKNDIEEQKETLSLEKLKNSEKIKTLKELIKELDEQMEAIEDDIDRLELDLVKTENDIKIGEKNIADIKVNIKENKSLIIEYIGHIYKESNLINISGEVDVIKTILLNEGSIGDILSDFHFKNLLEVTGQKLIDKHREYIRNLFLQRVELGRKVEVLEYSRKLLGAKKKYLDSKKLYKEKMLKITRGKDSLYQKFIEEKKKEEKEYTIKILKEKSNLEEVKDSILNKYNCPNINIVELSKGKISFEDINGLDNVDDCVEVAKIILLESKMKGTSEDEKEFVWPVSPELGLGAYFKDPDYYKTFWSDHDGIDIRVFQGTEVKAVKSGYVVFTKDPVDEGYSYVAIKHSDGLVSVYGHLSEVYVNKFDYIKQGDVIALSGGEMGTKGAGYITTGPHLHFEILKDSDYVDPLEYLNLSALTSKDIPSSKYVYKYYEDMKKKYGFELGQKLSFDFDVFSLYGKNEVERQKSLLAKYATPDFSEWKVWVEEGLDARIDPSLLMCIGLAETGLGKNLKTAYNVGNVGNTDSGSVYEFIDSRAGIYRIARTLNNKFLGKYDTLSKLSRYGNADGSIYASSSNHWHSNIVKCLTALKKRHIPDDFEFRLSSND